MTVIRSGVKYGARDAFSVSETGRNWGDKRVSKGGYAQSDALRCRAEDAATGRDALRPAAAPAGMRPENAWEVTEGMGTLTQGAAYSK